MSNLQIDLPYKIGKVFDGPARYRVAWGGRGGAKSTPFADMFLVYMLRYSRKKFLACREIQNSIKDSVHALLIERIYKLGLIGQFEWGESFLRHNEGGEVLYRGLLRNAAEIKSMQGVQVAWIEEAQSASQASLDYLFPTIREDDSEIWATLNPEDETDPIYTTLIEDPPENARVEKVNFYDNPWFPQVLEDERQRTLKQSPSKYNWIWEGGFNVDPEGSVYARWIQEADEQGRITTGIYDPNLPVRTAWDLGYGDCTSIWFFQVFGNEVRLIDFYQASGEAIKHYAEQLYGREINVTTWGENGKVEAYTLGDDIESAKHRKNYKYADHNLPHDSANKLLAAGGRSTLQQLKEFGVIATRIPATSQKNQIDAARSTIEKSYFDKERCKEGIRSLKKYKFKKDETLLRYSKDPLHDWSSHGCDAYEIIAQVWRSPAQEQPGQAKPRFLHEATANEIFKAHEEKQRTRI